MTKHKLFAALLGVFAMAGANASDIVQHEKIAKPTCEYGEPAPDAPAEFAQFSFLIGDYQVEGLGWFNNQWFANPNAKTPSRWNGRYSLNGKAITDEWFNEDPGVNKDTNVGVNVRMFDVEAAEWKMMWISNFNHVVQDLRAKVIDGKLTMWQVYPDRPDFKAEFEVVNENQWHRIHYGKNDAGEWEKKVKLLATRIPCPQ